MVDIAEICQKLNSGSFELCTNKPYLWSFRKDHRLPIFKWQVRTENMERITASTGTTYQHQRCEKKTILPCIARIDEKNTKVFIAMEKLLRKLACDLMRDFETIKPQLHMKTAIKSLIGITTWCGSSDFETSLCGNICAWGLDEVLRVRQSSCNFFASFYERAPPNEREEKRDTFV